MAKCEKLQVAQFFANFKENATYIANIFCMKKYGEIDFKNTSSLFVFRTEKSSIKMLIKSTPFRGGGHFVYLLSFLFTFKAAVSE